jgi:nifR3 family TIM-barrel protein
MRDLDFAVTLIDAVVAAVPVPVTLKMRLGWDESALNAPMLARRAENAGVALVTVHGRTRCQFYEGKADWRAIRRVKEAVRVPVVANGDVTTAADAAGMLAASGADAVMIGRAHYGAPWTAGQIAAAAAGRRFAAPRGEALTDYVVAHYEDMLVHYGVERGLRHARKHLGWYLDRHAQGLDPVLRAAAVTAPDPRSAIGALRAAFAAGAAPALRKTA